MKRRPALPLLEKQNHIFQRVDVKLNVKLHISQFDELGTSSHPVDIT